MQTQFSLYVSVALWVHVRSQTDTIAILSLCIGSFQHKLLKASRYIVIFCFCIGSFFISLSKLYRYKTVSLHLYRWNRETGPSTLPIQKCSLSFVSVKLRNRAFNSTDTEAVFVICIGRKSSSPKKHTPKNTQKNTQKTHTKNTHQKHTKRAWESSQALCLGLFICFSEPSGANYCLGFAIAACAAARRAIGTRNGLQET